jgi:hypothetical protein
LDAVARQADDALDQVDVLAGRSLENGDVAALRRLLENTPPL